MRLGQEARRRRLVTLEVIPDRVNPSELSLIKGLVDAVTVPALRNGSGDLSYPSAFHVPPQQRSLSFSLLVKRLGIEAVASLTCRDCRRSDLEKVSRLVGDGLENLLVVYGDAYGSEKDVYDFSSTDSLIDCVASSHESLSVGAITNQYAENGEREVERTLARVDAGADFVLTNTVFDEELFLEHRDRLLESGVDVPLLVQVSIPHSLENLVFVSRKFGIPVPDRLVRRMARNRWAGIDFAVEAFESLKVEANGVHFSYLLRKRNPIPVYCRLLERIGAVSVPVSTVGERVQEASYG